MIFSIRSFSNFNVFCRHSVFRSSSRTVCSGEGAFSARTWLLSTLCSAGLASFYLLILFRIWRINNISPGREGREDGEGNGDDVLRVLVMLLVGSSMIIV